MDSTSSVYHGYVGSYSTCSCILCKPIIYCYLVDKFYTLASSGIDGRCYDLKKASIQMKNLALYKIPIIYMLIYVILVLMSGVWLFLLSQGFESSESIMSTLKNVVTAPACKSVEGLIEVVTPHLFAIGTLIFVTAHFMLFSTKVSPKMSLRVAMLLFIFALFDIFSYFVISFGVVVSGWVKLVALSIFVLLFLVMLGLVAFSL